MQSLHIVTLLKYCKVQPYGEVFKFSKILQRSLSDEKCKSIARYIELDAEEYIERRWVESDS